MEQPLVDKEYLLQKFSGKGGWTYAAIPEVLPSQENPFGWVKVKGFIDNIPFSKYHLAPMGDGRLFLPVKKEIRKKIKKEAGSYVHIILYPDDEPTIVPEEIMSCLENEPEALRFFNSLSDSEKQAYLKWVYSAKKEDTKVERIVKMLDKLTQSLKFNDK